MRVMKRPLWLVAAVIGITVFGLLSMIHGAMVMMTPDLSLLSYIFGIIGIAFGILDVIAAYTMWKTGRPWFILFLFGPLVSFFGKPLEIELDWLFIIMFLMVALLVAVFLVFVIVTSRNVREVLGE
jgi:hypothetical protein